MRLPKWLQWIAAPSPIVENIANIGSVVLTLGLIALLWVPTISGRIIGTVPGGTSWLPFYGSLFGSAVTVTGAVTLAWWQRGAQSRSERRRACSTAARMAYEALAEASPSVRAAAAETVNTARGHLMATQQRAEYLVKESRSAIDEFRKSAVWPDWARLIDPSVNATAVRVSSESAMDAVTLRRTGELEATFLLLLSEYTRNYGHFVSAAAPILGEIERIRAIPNTDQAILKLGAKLGSQVQADVRSLLVEDLPKLEVALRDQFASLLAQLRDAWQRQGSVFVFFHEKLPHNWGSSTETHLKALGWAIGSTQTKAGLDEVSPGLSVSITTLHALLAKASQSGGEFARLKKDREPGIGRIFAVGHGPKKLSAAWTPIARSIHAFTASPLFFSLPFPVQSDLTRLAVAMEAAGADPETATQTVSEMLTGWKRYREVARLCTKISKATANDLVAPNDAAVEATFARAIREVEILQFAELDPDGVKFSALNLLAEVAYAEH